MRRAPNREDRLRAVFVCRDVEALGACVTFYTEVLGFEVEHQRPGLVGLRDGPSRLVLAAPGAAPFMPAVPTSGAVLILATIDAAAARRGLVARWHGPTSEIVDSGPGARHFEVVDPAGNRIWLMEIAAQEPEPAPGP